MDDRGDVREVDMAPPSSRSTIDMSSAPLSGRSAFGSSGADPSLKWLGFLPPTQSFGTRWQDDAFEMGALIIEASDFQVRSIKVLSRLEAVQDKFFVGAMLHPVVLMESEVIVEIGVRRDDRQNIVGLQIRTNLRTIPWCGGHRGEVEYVQAPAGCYISSFKGENVQTRAFGWVCEVTCRFRSTAEEQWSEPMRSPPSAPYRLSEQVLFCDPDVVDCPFFVYHPQLHSVVLVCSDGVKELTILTTEQYNRCLASRQMPLAPNERVFSLVKGEHITEVDVAHDKASFGLCLVTNKRRTLWFGRYQTERDTITKLTMQCSSDETGSICGFFGSVTKTGEICGIGVIYTCEQRSEAESITDVGH